MQTIMFPAKEEVEIGETKVLILFFKFVAFGKTLIFEVINCLLSLKLFPDKRRHSRLLET